MNKERYKRSQKQHQLEIKMHVSPPQEGICDLEIYNLHKFTTPTGI